MSDRAGQPACLPFAVSRDGLRVALRVTPKARSQGIGGPVDTADGGVALRVQVTEPADKGQANGAVIKLLAKEWGVAKSSLEIIQGQTARSKTLLIRGDGTVLMRSLTNWLTNKKIRKD